MNEYHIFTTDGKNFTIWADGFTGFDNAYSFWNNSPGSSSIAEFPRDKVIGIFQETAVTRQKSRVKTKEKKAA